MYDFTLDELENSSKFKSLPLEDRSGIARLYVEKKGPDEAIAKFQKIASDPEFSALPDQDRESFKQSFSQFYGIDLPLDNVSFGTDVKDVVMSGLAGTSAIPKAAATVAGWLGFDDSKESLLEIAKTTENFYNAKISKQGRQVQEQDFLSDKDGKWFGDNAIKKVFMVSAESLPLMIATAPIGGAASAAVSRASFLPNFVRALEGGSKAGQWSHNLLTFGASEAGTSALVSAADAGEKVATMDEKVLAKSPVYRALLEQGMDPATARAELRGIVEEETFRTQAAATLAGSAISPGGAMSKLFQKGVAKKGIAREFVEGMGSEALQEAPQSGLEQLGENITTQRNLDPAQSLTENVGEAAALGAASGGLTGGAMGGGAKLITLKDAQAVAGNTPLNADPEAIAVQIEAATGDAAVAPAVNIPGLNLADLTQEDVEDIAAISQRIARADLGQLQQLSAAVPTLRERRPTIAPHIENILSERIGQLNAQAERAMQQQVPAFDQTAEQAYQDDLMDDWGDTEADVQQQTEARGRRQGFERLKEDLVTRTLNQESLAANRTGRPSTAEEAAAAFEEAGQTETMAETEQRLARREDAEAAFADKNVMLPRDIANAIVKMESDLRQGEKNTVIVEGQGNNQGVIGGAPSTNPEWFKAKTIQAYDKQHGTEYAKNVTKDAIFSALDKIRSGQKLTTKRERMSWAYLRIAAEQEVGRDPELIAGNEFANLEQEGFEFESPRQIAVGDMKKGDQVVVLGKNGVPDKLTHKGRDKSGNIVLQDGVRMEVDEFDVIPDVIAQKESPPTTAPSPVGENQGGPPQAALGSRFDDAIPNSEKNYAQKQGQLDGVKRIATSGEVDQEVSEKPARDIGAGIVFDQAPGRLIVGGRKNGAGEEGPGADAKRRGYDDIPRTTAVDNPGSIANGQEVNQPPQQVSTSGAGEQSTAPPASQGVVNGFVRDSGNQNTQRQAAKKASEPSAAAETNQGSSQAAQESGVATGGARPLPEPTYTPEELSTIDVDVSLFDTSDGKPIRMNAKDALQLIDDDIAIYDKLRRCVEA